MSVILLLLQALSVSSRVDSVVVYPHQVLVVRNATVTVAGPGELVFPGLPGALDDNSVRVRAPAEPFRAEARVRYQGRGGKALVEPIGEGRVRVTFDAPQWAPTPGQAVVFWQGDCCIGGAMIERSMRE